uniref:Uncharacterized protein n=1 Tax=Octopus bimaculoides TaxID=37653 RepID=A0A0L8IG56_OCTBM
MRLNFSYFLLMRSYTNETSQWLLTYHQHAHVFIYVCVCRYISMINMVEVWEIYE